MSKQHHFKDLMSDEHAIPPLLLLHWAVGDKAGRHMFDEMLLG